MGVIAPLVTCDDDGNYSVCTESLKWLEDQKVPLGVLACAGKFRTGKSYLMNRMSNARSGEGFGVGDTVQACTKGIWIRKEVFKGDNYNYICIDTEGIDALDADNTHDVRIFTLGLLLSSMFIYNSIGPIDESSLQTLALMTKVSKYVKINNESDATIKELSEYFPHFTWALRDFSLKITDKQGNAVSNEQYVLQSLSDNEGSGERCAIRKTIKDAFPNISLFTFPRPTTDEFLSQLDKNPKVVNSIFNSKVAEIKNFISHNITPIKTNGIQMSGSMYAKYVVHLVNGIGENSQVPVIKDAWSLMSEVRAMDMKHKIEQEVDEHIKCRSNAFVSVDCMRHELTQYIDRKMSEFTSELLEEQPDTHKQLSKSLHDKMETAVSLVEMNIDKKILLEVNSVNKKLAIGNDNLLNIIKSSIGDLSTNGDDQIVRIWKERICNELIETWIPNMLKTHNEQLENNAFNTNSLKQKIDQENSIKESMETEHEQKITQMTEEFKSTRVEMQQIIDHTNIQLQTAHDLNSEITTKLIETEVRLEEVQTREQEASICIDKIYDNLKTNSDDDEDIPDCTNNKTCETETYCKQLQEEIKGLKEELSELSEIRSNLANQLEKNREFEKEQTPKWLSQIESLKMDNLNRYTKFKENTASQIDVFKKELANMNEKYERTVTEKNIMRNSLMSIETKFEDDKVHHNIQLKNIHRCEERQRELCVQLQDKIIKMHKTLLDDTREKDDKNRNEYSKRYREIIETTSKLSNVTVQLEQTRNENESLKRRIDTFEDNEREIKKMRTDDVDNKQRFMQLQTELKELRARRDEVVREREDVRNILMENERKLAISTRELQIEKAKYLTS